MEVQVKFGVESALAPPHTHAPPALVAYDGVSHATNASSDAAAPALNPSSAERVPVSKVSTGDRDLSEHGRADTDPIAPGPCPPEDAGDSGRDLTASTSQATEFVRSPRECEVEHLPFLDADSAGNKNESYSFVEDVMSPVPGMMMRFLSATILACPIRHACCGYVPR